RNCASDAPAHLSAEPGPRINRPERHATGWTPAEFLYKSCLIYAMETTMTDWLAGQAEAMDRKVEGRKRDGEPVRAVVMARSYPTDIEDLWQAITDPERICRWLLPVSGDL